MFEINYSQLIQYEILEKLVTLIPVLKAGHKSSYLHCPQGECRDELANIMNIDYGLVLFNGTTAMVKHNTYLINS